MGDRGLGNLTNNGKNYIFTRDEHKNYQGKDDEIGIECSIYGGEQECIENFGGKARRKETTRKT
jgi:hypothetical protein